jgi:hypothetical protein
VRIRWKPEALAYRVRHTARADLESNGGQPEFSGSNGLRVNGRVDPLFDPGMNQLSSFRDFLRKLLLTPAACVYATPTVTNFIREHILCKLHPLCIICTQQWGAGGR